MLYREKVNLIFSHLKLMCELLSVSCRDNVCFVFCLAEKTCMLSSVLYTQRVHWFISCVFCLMSDMETTYLLSSGL